MLKLPPAKISLPADKFNLYSLSNNMKITSFCVAYILIFDATIFASQTRIEPLSFHTFKSKSFTDISPKNTILDTFVPATHGLDVS